MCRRGRWRAETKKPRGRARLLGDGAAPDERFLAVRAGDSRGWNLVDFLAYLIR